MTTTCLTSERKVLRIIKYVLMLTFVGFALSVFIARSMVNQYSASITLFVDPENVLGDIAKGVAVSTSLKDQITTLRHFVQSDDFVELHVIQELNMRLSDVFVPPAGLTFMPAVLKPVNAVKDLFKQMAGLEVLTLSNKQKLSNEQEEALEQKELITTIKNHIQLSVNEDTLFTISYTGPNQIAGQKIVELVANQCKEFLLRVKSNETKEAARYIERQYSEATQKLENLEQELMKMRVDLFDKTPEAKIAKLQQRKNALDILWLVEQRLADLDAQKASLIEAQRKRREMLLWNPTSRLKLFELLQHDAAREMTLTKAQLAALSSIYTSDWPEIIALNARIAELEQILKLNVVTNEEVIAHALVFDQSYHEYVRQIEQVETAERSLRTKVQILQDVIAIYDTQIKNMPEFEKSFGTIERQISLYVKLQAELASKRETARTTMQLEQSRGENRIRQVERSFPTKPIAPALFFAMLPVFWAVTCVGSGIIYLGYVVKIAVKNRRNRRA